MEAKSSKAARSELQLISHAFFNDTPEECHLGGLAGSYPDRFSQCPAHLSNLKVFDKKVADLCLTQPEAHLDLRTVNTQELLSADRKLWNAISSRSAVDLG